MTVGASPTKICAGTIRHRRFLLSLFTLPQSVLFDGPDRFSRCGAIFGPRRLLHRFNRLLNS
jgi:hypothetical protein